MKHSLARLVAGLLDRLDEQVERLLVGLQLGSEAALVADAAAEVALVEHLLQRLVDLGHGADPVGERRRTDRADHELLEIDVVVGVGATVEHVRQRQRQQPRLGAAEVAIERDPGRGRRGMGRGERHAEDRVGAQPALVRGPVEVDHRLVDAGLVERVHADHGRSEVAVDVSDRLQHALAAVPLAVAVAQLDRFVRAGGRTGRDARRPTSNRGPHRDGKGRVAS